MSKPRVLVLVRRGAAQEKISTRVPRKYQKILRKHYLVAIPFAMTEVSNLLQAKILKKRRNIL